MHKEEWCANWKLQSCTLGVYIICFFLDFFLLLFPRLIRLCDFAFHLSLTSQHIGLIYLFNNPHYKQSWQVEVFAVPDWKNSWDKKDMFSPKLVYQRFFRVGYMYLICHCVDQWRSGCNPLHLCFRQALPKIWARNPSITQYPHTAGQDEHEVTIGNFCSHPNSSVCQDTVSAGQSLPKRWECILPKLTLNVHANGPYENCGQNMFFSSNTHR